MASDFDGKLAARLEGDIDGLVEELRKMATSTVEVRAEIRDDPCVKCGCQHVRYARVEVPDVKTKLAVAEWLSNRGFGRPGQVVEEGSGGIVFERVVYMSLEEGVTTPAHAAQV